MKIEEELKMKTFESEYQRAILNVMFTGYWLSERSNEIFKPHGISEQQYNVLRILRGQCGNMINLCDVQSRMMHKMSNATRLVEKLRLKGYVERNTCIDNRRMVDINITEKGLALLKEIDVEVMSKHEDIRHKLNEEESQQLSLLLEKLRS